MRSIVPFLPFSEHEQAVVAHSFILNLTDSFRRDIKMATRDIIGRTHVVLHKDEDVCAHIARMSYHAKLGARAIKNGVDRHIRLPLDKLWRAHDDLVSEKVNKLPLTRYMIQLAKKKDIATIHVHEKGTKTLPAGNS